MSEYTLQAIASLKVCWVGVGSLLYGIGGTEINGKGRKWIRRFILPLWMGLGIWTFGVWTGSFTLIQLLYVPLLSASLHCGYGGTNDVLVKIRKRFIYGLCLGISALPLLFSDRFIKYAVDIIKNLPNILNDGFDHGDFLMGINAYHFTINSGMLVLFAFHIALCVTSSVLLGVFNPTKNARSEESLICVLSTVSVLFLQ